MDEDVRFANCEPLEKEGPVAVVLLPMLEHPTVTPSFNWQNPLIKPPNRSSNLEIEALTSKKITKLLEFKPQAKSLFSLFKF